MLVVTANWAVTDGSLGMPTTGAAAVRGWFAGLRQATVRAGFARDGRYEPPTGIDLVFAGDTLDLLTSIAWSGRDRPWRCGARAAEARRRVLLGCTRRAARLLAGLTRLARYGLPVPAADRRGRPTPSALVRTAVRIALLPGDRDHSLGEAAAMVAARGATVAPAWADEMVDVAHGHELDPTRHVAEHPATEDRAPSLAESVAVDLVVPFAVALERAGVPPAAARPLVAALAGADVVDLAPVLAAWRAGAGAAVSLDAATSRAVDAAWGRAVDGWLRTARREPPDGGLPGSPLESLAAWFAATPPGPPTPALDLLRVSRPPAPRATTGRHRWLVLGHPPASSGGGATICLGRPPVRPWMPVAVVRGSTATEVSCVAAVPPLGPATVVCRRDGGRPEWHHPTGAGPSLEGTASGRGGVVDAA